MGTAKKISLNFKIKVVRLKNLSWQDSIINAFKTQFGEKQIRINRSRELQDCFEIYYLSHKEIRICTILVSDLAIVIRQDRRNSILPDCQPENYWQELTDIMLEINPRVREFDLQICLSAP